MNVISALAAAGAVLASACANPAQAADGAQIFKNTCEACHQPGGVGTPGLAPPLVSPVIANAAGRQKLYPALVVVNGLTGSIALADGSKIASAMPAQRSLSDEEVAAVLGYVYRLNQIEAQVTPADVAHLRDRSVGNDELKRMRAELMP